MVYSGINLENVKISNRSTILKLLNDCGAMSRKDIAQRLGLTPATVTQISMKLLAAGILCEKGELEEEKRAGRRKVLIDINYTYRYVLSICIEAARTYIAISDLRGKSVGIREFSTDGTREPEKFLKQIAAESKAFMWETGIVKESVLGVGVSVPGPVDREQGISSHAFRIWNEPVHIGEYLQKSLELPVIVENNIKAFAEGELIYGNGKNQENLLFIKWGPGVGAALIVNGQIYQRIVEIGHYIVEKDGKPCRCGRKGCLETKVATHAVAERIRETCTRETMPRLWKRVNGDVGRIEARNIAQWFSMEDEGFRREMDDIIDEIARAVVNAGTMVDPDRVVIYGEMFELPGVMERFIQYCGYYDPVYGDGHIIKSGLGDRISYIGPLAVVVNEMFFNSED